MINKDFFKTLIIFTGMIAVGLLGVFLVNSLGERNEANVNSSVEVAR